MAMTIQDEISESKAQMFAEMRESLRKFHRKTGLLVTAVRFKNNCLRSNDGNILSPMYCEFEASVEIQDYMISGH